MRALTRCAALLYVLAACSGAVGGGEGAAGTSRTERSKVGDTTVVRTIGAASPTVELSLTRELVIGKLDGPDYEMFKELSLVTPTPDGGVLFFDSGAATVRRFDSAGVYLNSFGRRGKGPGEYTLAYNIDLMPDSTVLVEGDESLNRFSADGRSVGDRDIWFTDPKTLGSQLTVTADGFIHVQRTMYDPRKADSTNASGSRVTTQVVHRLRIDGQAIDTIFRPEPRMVAPRIKYQRPGATQPSYRAIPLVPAFIIIYSKQGYWVTSGDDSLYTITLHRREGGPLRIESDLERVRAQGEERAWYFRSFAAAMSRLAPGSADMKLIPEVKPFLQDIGTDADGRIWAQLRQPAKHETIDTMAVEEGRSSGGFVEEVVMSGAGEFVAMRSAPPGPRETERWVEPVVYDVFAPTGEFLGRLRLPERARFGNARGDRVWLIMRDENDVETLVRFRMNKGA